MDAIDTTGAGDCFVGAFAAALARSDSVPHAINFANMVAAISITRRGATSSFPMLAEVRQSRVRKN